MLERNAADQKWLVVLTDLQSHEFPRPMENQPDQRTVLIDLHPDNRPIRAALLGFRFIRPSRFRASAVKWTIDVAGRGRIAALSSRDFSSPMARSSRTPARNGEFRRQRRAPSFACPSNCPPSRGCSLNRKFSEEDDMPWDDARSLLVHLPPRRAVRMLDFTGGSQAARFVELGWIQTRGSSSPGPWRCAAVMRSAAMIRSSSRCFHDGRTRRQPGDLLSLRTPARRSSSFCSPAWKRYGQDPSRAQRTAWLNLSPCRSRRGISCHASARDAADRGSTADGRCRRRR